MPATHRLGKQETAQSSRHVGRYGRRKEEPRVRTVARAGALNRDRYADRSAGFGERRHVFLPFTFVEVDCQKPAGLLFQERVDTHDMSPLQVLDEKPVAHRDEVLVRALSALPFDLEHASWLPFVEARRRVARFPRLLAHEPNREHIPAATK
jgi:hypothetical protein